MIARALAVLCFLSASAALVLALDGWSKTHLVGILVVHLKAVPVPLALGWILWRFED